MRDDYRDLAPLYDGMAADKGIRSFYGEWRRHLLDAARERGLRLRVLVDLACGTGNSTIPWTRRRGLSVVGVDRSEAMLRVARSKSAHVRWYKQDLTRLRIRERADAVTCHFDALNHVLRTEDLQRVFSNVATILNVGGLFQFDLNTVHMLRWLNGRDKLFLVGSNIFTATNTFDKATGIATFRQLWFVPRGRLYAFHDVVVRERAYSDTQLRAMLRAAGLRLAQGKVQRTLEGRPVRKLYLAVRT